jgi:deoxyribodipyrimidine photo-lyase
MNQLSFLDETQSSVGTVDWMPTRAASLARLHEFLPRAGRSYAKSRNFDLGPADRSNISCLSPWIRHRLVLEQEVVSGVLSKSSYSAAEKFLQEVFWRSYFKGWLEQHPDVWLSYRRELRRLLDACEKSSSLRTRYEEATEGRTGLECFDTWARELIETGFLHNYTRMWFASIWIFTLRLPWQLGADFFLRLLLDGDPASNTLSWRWVGGLHTKGKTYLARPANIAQFTNDRFKPTGQLVTNAAPLEEDDTGSSILIPPADQSPQELPFGLLITEEDCNPESLGLLQSPSGIIGLIATNQRSPLPIGELSRAFARGAVDDAVSRAQDLYQVEQPAISAPQDWATTLRDFAARFGIKVIVTSYAPVGPVAEQLSAAGLALEPSGIRLIRLRRPYDDAAWPHATKGFFKLKAQIPKLIAQFG